MAVGAFLWASLLLAGQPFAAQLTLEAETDSLGTPVVAYNVMEVASTGADEVHLCIFSGRTEGLVGTLKSVALHAQEPEKVHVWIVTDDISAVDKAGSYLSDTGINLHAINLDDAVEDLKTNGYKPIWLWDEYKTSVYGPDGVMRQEWVNENTARPFDWDHDLMHMHRLNHLRFYIPHLSQFKDLDRIIFLDDDLIVQTDVRQAWDSKENFPKGSVMAGTCDFWRYRTGLSSYVFEGRSNYARSFTLPQGGRSLDHTYCYGWKKQGCVGGNHWTNLNKRFEEIHGKKYKPWDQTEWNFGYVLFDLTAWRKQKLTDIYEKWMKVNYEDHIYPETSVMFGLGIAYMAFYDRVSCWEDVSKPAINIRDGLGYISFSEMQFTGMTDSYLTSASVLHYDGKSKPWMANADMILRIPYEKTLEGLTLKEYAPIVKKVVKEGLQRNLNSSFLVVTDGSYNTAYSLLEELEKNEQLCISSPKSTDRVSFPAEMFEPYSSNFEKTPNRLKNQCYFSFVSHHIQEVAQNYHQWCVEGDRSQSNQYIAQHLPMMCSLVAKHGEGENSDKKINRMDLFSHFFERLMTGDESLSACTCPATTTSAGAFIHTDYVSFNKKGNSDAIPANVFLSSLEAVRPKIIFLKEGKEDSRFERNLEALGLQVRTESSTDCMNSMTKCVENVQQFIGVEGL
eukprot:CAMPEP_0184487464 /NCGR_PEP_ID=MMETSP0113_2-20130426/10130_1 /TAXON_ID=91329 /ORGANISM="Norrisiella sphaerica, Strain BC52" /LENGTH=678 /DNA_ID=CAMNT_0026869793 /DNA_START=6 /DNA_END=2042 /DNA_ORIENTATION=-